MCDILSHKAQIDQLLTIHRPPQTNYCNSVNAPSPPKTKSEDTKFGASWNGRFRGNIQLQKYASQLCCYEMFAGSPLGISVHCSQTHLLYDIELMRAAFPVFITKR